MAQISSVFPMSREWDRAVDDVATVPIDAASIRLVSRAKNMARLPSYTKLTSLWCFDIGARELEAVCSCASLESLYIENIKTADLSGFKRLPKLSVLGLETCSKVSSLADLAGLQSLEGLAITHFKNVHDLAPLSQLPRLCSLAVAGSMWTTMRVASLEPLKELVALQFLHLTNIKPDDLSLRPLGQLTNLKMLDIANFYPTSEFTWLARRLQSTECPWFKPYVELASFSCKKCGGSKAMLTGKGTTTICMTCDRTRLEKHLREWHS